jgi:hypothetical protein
MTWLPMPLIMAFVRERGNVIDYEIPITGNLKNPKFHFRDVILDALTNIFVKPPTTPYRMQVKTLETNIEKSLTMTWESRQYQLHPRQGRFIAKIAYFLAKTPNATINVYPQQYSLKEKEYILFYEAKKKYFLVANNKNNNSYDESDSIAVEKMSVRDGGFVNYLNKQSKDPLIFTIQGKCAEVIEAGLVDACYQHLNAEREKVFKDYFIERGVEKQVKFANGNSVIPYNGFSFYKIEYKGEFPKSLNKAYQLMRELNNEAPRKKFWKDRKSIKDAPITSYDNSLFDTVIGYYTQSTTTLR